jgi:hypothetical protein
MAMPVYARFLAHPVRHSGTLGYFERSAPEPDRFWRLSTLSAGIFNLSHYTQGRPPFAERPQIRSNLASQKANDK